MQKHFWVALALASMAPAGAAQVYRCGNAYSAQPCPGGVAVEASPPVTDPDGPSTTVLNLCRAPKGALSWSKETCASRGWVIERTARVANNVSWEAQLKAANAQRVEAQQLTAVRPARTRPAPSASPGESKERTCQALEEKVQQLDRKGRAGSRYYDLERVRHERQLARDQQFRLRCR